MHSLGSNVKGLPRFRYLCAAFFSYEKLFQANIVNVFFVCFAVLVCMELEVSILWQYFGVACPASWII